MVYKKIKVWYSGCGKVEQVRKVARDGKLPMHERT